MLECKWPSSLRPFVAIVRLVLLHGGYGCLETGNSIAHVALPMSSAKVHLYLTKASCFLKAFSLCVIECNSVVFVLGASARWQVHLISISRYALWF